MKFPIQFFTLVAANNARETFSRQEDDDDDENRVPTLNPHILPQVAQILGAIFAGSLNISAVLDQSFTLVPGFLRNQLDGIFKLLTQQQMATTTTTAQPAKAKPPKKRKTTTPSPASEAPLPDYEAETESVPGAEKVAITTSTSKTISALRNATVLASEEEVFEEDSKLYRLQEELVAAAHDAEPYVRDKQPRFFVSSINEIMRNLDRGRLNITQIVRFLPDLFQGARHAFVLLENLGKIAGVDLDSDDDSE